MTRADAEAAAGGVSDGVKAVDDSSPEGTIPRRGRIVVSLLLVPEFSLVGGQVWGEPVVSVPFRGTSGAQKCDSRFYFFEEDSSNAWRVGEQNLISSASTCRNNCRD